MNGAENPIVSVIMPAYNAEAYVQKAIASVLAQTMDTWELIVVDDCSTDATYEKAEAVSRGDARIQVLRNEVNSGVSKTRNRGIDLARGRYIAFLDSDDVWHPNKLERQLERLTKEDAQIGYCSYAIIGADGQKARADYLVPEQVTFEDLLKENCIQCSAMLIRADVVKKFRFNTEFYHEDYVLGLQMLQNGYRAAGCSEILLSWRYIENSRSFNKWKSAKNRWKIYREFLHLPLGKSMYVFAHYAFAGLRKYTRKHESIGENA